MGQKGKSIIVTGDVTIDWYQFFIPACDKGNNWELYNGTHSISHLGGTWLLAEFIELFLKEKILEDEITIIKPLLPAAIESVSPEQIIHSKVQLTQVNKHNSEISLTKNAGRYYIDKFLGYSGPSDNSRPPLIELTQNPDQSDIIVIDDAGNGYRDFNGNCLEAWPKAIVSTKTSYIFYKMSRPLVEGKLWQHVSKNVQDNLIVIVHADDLRKFVEINISKSLSWEQTAKDFIFNLQRHEGLESLRTVPYLIVLFGTEGAIFHRGDKSQQDYLIFDPARLENQFSLEYSGSVMGTTSLFTASLVSHVEEYGLAGLTKGIKKGLSYIRTFLKTGYSIDNRNIEFPSLKLLSSELKLNNFASCKIPPANDLYSADSEFWRILDEKTSGFRQLVARDLVVKGESSISVLKQIPTGSFGYFQTIDRAEIESYGAIKELILEFLQNPKPKRPLSLAVFGPPGSGKSFGVEQIINSLNRNDIQQETFNISQFDNYSDLIAAFQKVRDIALQGKIPFVFFDEFDSSLQGQELGWLKYFLAPMQDSLFKEGSSIHPICKNAIFVFAGGTKSTYGDFIGDENDNSDFVQEFRDAKGPDFISRLRGFINVMGPNRQKTKDNNDDAYIIRRAKVLRVLLMMNAKTSQLINSRDEIMIDPGLLRAMLNISNYKHGMRSIEALIDMSRLAGKKCFDLSSLPSKAQLNLHVDADEFLFYAEKERFQSMLTLSDIPTSGADSFKEIEDNLISKIAPLIHAHYLLHQNHSPSTTSVKYRKLPPEKKYSNEDAARDIPNKLFFLGFGIRKKTKNPNKFKITSQEFDLLATLEHERWCHDQRLQGYKEGEQRNTNLKTSPYLVPFMELTQEIKGYDYNAVHSIPLILDELDFEIYRMNEELSEIND